MYDLFNVEVMKKAKSVYEQDGIEEAEKILIEYYSKDIQFNKNRLNNCQEFSIRCDLVNLAFDEHLNQRYHSSILLFLSIIDGVVNDYTKRKGFFAEGTDLSAWDCLVGASEGLGYFSRRMSGNLQADAVFASIFLLSLLGIVLFLLIGFVEKQLLKNRRFQ
jgi:hypothetical protein